ncbi:unnamed protein product [Adineta ricciae]|uniref:Uncharacterized protein n=1 Tax=Adineta ricciae TaxID=249248 RepID=A0A816BH21_ADIRI|nr:unnamed protein product [Adineta ricciae]
MVNILYSMENLNQKKNTKFQNSFWINKKHCDISCLIHHQLDRVFESFLFLLFHLVIIGFHQHYKELNIADFFQCNSIFSPFSQIETLILQCSVPKIETLRSVVNLFTSETFENSTANLNESTLKSSSLLKFNDYHLLENIIYEQIKCLTIINIIDGNDLKEISQLFPKIERITLTGKERDEILPILTQLQYLISTKIQ